MSKDPRIFVVLGKDASGFDITDMIEELRFKESIKKENKLTIKIGANYVNSLLERSDFEEGKFINFSFGFNGGKMSMTHLAIITDLTPAWAGDGGASMTFEARDKGIVLKKDESGRIWKGRNTKEIIEEIAAAHEMTTEIEDIGKFTTWPSLPQGGLTDFEFLRNLARREHNGIYQLYILGSTIYFTSLATATDPKETYTIGDPESGVMSFTPKKKETGAGKKSSGVKLSSLDIHKKTTINSEADDLNEKLENELGRFRTINKTGDWGDVIGNLPSDAKPTYSKGKRLQGGGIDTTQPVGKTKAATETNVANSDFKKGKKKLLKGELKLSLDVDKRPNTVISITGVPTRYKGRWLIEEVEHFVGRGAATTTLTLNKGAGKTESNVKAKEAASSKKEGPNKKPPRTVSIYEGEYYQKNEATNKYEMKNRSEARPVDNSSYLNKVHSNDINNFQPSTKPTTVNGNKPPAKIKQRK